MNSKTKSALVLLGTLVLGVALGAMLWSAAHNQRMAKIRSLRDRGALPTVIENVVHPENESQREQVQVVVSKYEDKLSRIYHELRRARSEATDSLRYHLGEILSEDQAVLLDEWLRERRRPSRSDGRGDSSSSND